jgi:hypothetical protein
MLISSCVNSSLKRDLSTRTLGAYNSSSRISPQTVPKTKSSGIKSVSGISLTSRV